MIEFFDSAKFLAGTEVAAIAASALSFVSVLYSILASIFGLRAKKHARLAILRAKKEARDARVRTLLTSDYKEKFSEKDLILLRKIIAKDEVTVTAKDLQYIDHGLNQSNRDGVQRYARDLLSAA
ncbi:MULTISPECIES: hypothetical protein [unclassified Methylobacterium]|uniref:hypothetical protein n=1 Tax=unclassified Methylobacterium TaxID=2615210 RepID=UPI0011C20B6E|nr:MULTISPECIES: hypothetical protein [unclassified Methylobacterium]QEE38710.1 hypothetical protein FVA80_06700 [Methylobacterium sp. WL1]TXN57178.1 hypothetical protein FV241_12460 [Methylobacterium sp. WL2]